MSFPMKFNGSVIDRIGEIFLIQQKEYAMYFSPLSPSRFSANDIAHRRGQLAYIATNNLPDTTFFSAQLAI